MKSDIVSVTAAVDTVLLQSLGWTDAVDDLPLTHSFGFVYGYQEAFSAARSVHAPVYASLSLTLVSAREQIPTKKLRYSHALLVA